MNHVRLIALLAMLATAPGAARAASSSDWNQWRGPLRNGVVPDSPPLAGEWPAEGLPLLWESERIPANDDGGHGSPVVAGNRVYLSVVWHWDVPSETRTITDLVLRQLGYQNPAGLGKEVVEKMEAARLSLSPQMRGAKLDEFINQFIQENLNKRQQQTIAGFVRGRFKKGRFAIPLEDYDKMVTVENQPFPNEAAFLKWVDAQEFPDFVKEELIKAVPPTKRVAEDTVICLDLETGKTLWKAAAPGEPRGRNCSSTPAVANGKVFAMGSTHLYAVDADSGKILWSTPLPSKGPGSSPLAVDGAVVVNAGKLTAYDAATGKQLWQLDKIGGGQSSPAAWRKDGRTLVICNARNDLAGVDLNSGKVLWTVPGGGDATPAIAGDFLAVQSRNASIGLTALKLDLASPKQLWTFPIDAVRTQASPVIYEGHVYLLDDNYSYCLSLDSGSVAWKQQHVSSITSPAIADGKLFSLANSGNNILMLKATSKERVELGKSNVRALWCPSPTIAQGRLLVRTANNVRCYDLTAGAKLSASAR